MVLALYIVVFVLLAGDIVGFAYFSRRVKRLADTATEKTYAMGEANLKLLELTEAQEAQKYQLAEANIKMLEQKEQIEIERERSEKLLLNILPPKVAQELKETGKAEPVSFENVSVLFADIIGFTEAASQMEPKALIEELNEVFTAFDMIARRNRCVRIKTIGDAYLSVCGMPESDDHHAENILSSAVEMVGYLAERNSGSARQWRVRIGAHTGKVVGGVVGVEKYIYDVFGDTINLTSRLEQSSESMRITASDDIRRLAQGKFEFEERGDLALKGKGAVRAYYVGAHK